MMWIIKFVFCFLFQVPQHRCRLFCMGRGKEVNVAPGLHGAPHSCTCTSQLSLLGPATHLQTLPSRCLLFATVSGSKCVQTSFFQTTGTLEPATAYQSLCCASRGSLIQHPFKLYRTVHWNPNPAASQDAYLHTSS